jgi:hypothetical protein
MRRGGDHLNRKVARFPGSTSAVYFPCCKTVNTLIFKPQVLLFLGVATVNKYLNFQRKGSFMQSPRDQEVKPLQVSGCCP